MSRSDFHISFPLSLLSLFLFLFLLPQPKIPWLLVIFIWSLGYITIMPNSQMPVNQTKPNHTSYNKTKQSEEKNHIHMTNLKNDGGRTWKSRKEWIGSERTFGNSQYSVPLNKIPLFVLFCTDEDVDCVSSSQSRITGRPRKDKTNEQQ